MLAYPSGGELDVVVGEHAGPVPDPAGPPLRLLLGDLDLLSGGKAEVPRLLRLIIEHRDVDLLGSVGSWGVRRVRGRGSAGLQGLDAHVHRGNVTGTELK